MSSKRLSEVTVHAIGGGWGQDVPDDRHTERVAIIRGTDIPRIAVGDLSTVPRRFEVASKLKSRLLQTGDIVVEVSGGSAASGQHTGRSLVMTAHIIEDLGGRVMPASFCRLLRLSQGEVDPTFIYYQMMGLHLSGEIANFENQSTGIANFQFTRFIESVQPALAEVEDQRKVGQVLRLFDERITLLRETNVTLESIAQALFKSWFVDFDPVRAKQRGLTPAGMDEATAALFPDSYIQSGTGLVPVGWEQTSVYDIATYVNGAAYKAFEPNPVRRGRPIIKIAELKSGVTAQTAFSAVEMPDKYLIRTGDILFSWSGNPDTSIDTFVWTHEPAWLNQHIFRVLPHSVVDRAFVLQLLRHLRPMFAELARNKQTTGLGHVTVADMKRLLVAKPSRDVVAAFESCVGPIQARMFANQQQAQTLATLRDALLPRLISGQLRLPEAGTLAAVA